MKDKKSLLVALLIAGYGLTPIWSQTMFVKEKSDAETAYSLNDIRKICFIPGNMIVNLNSGDADSYIITDLRYVNFDRFVIDINENRNEEIPGFHLYPNPVNEVLTIEISPESNRQLQIEILSIEGNMIHKQVIYSNNPTNSVQINVSGLPRGIYVIRLLQDMTANTTRFIKN